MPTSTRVVPNTVHQHYCLRYSAQLTTKMSTAAVLYARNCKIATLQGTARTVQQQHQQAGQAVNTQSHVQDLLLPGQHLPVKAYQEAGDRHAKCHNAHVPMRDFQRKSQSAH